MKTKLHVAAVFCTFFVFASAQQQTVEEYMKEFRYKEAIQWLDTREERAETLRLKAQCFEKLYDYQSAAAVYEKLLLQTPNDANLLIDAAECASRAGDTDASLKYWIRASELMPENLFIRIQKTLACYKAGQWSQTIENADTVFKTDSIPLLLRIVGESYMYKEEPALANYFYTRALEKNPSDYRSLEHICNYYYALGEIGYDTVITMTDNYLTTVNENRKSIGRLNAMANYSAGNYKKAIARLVKNIELGDSTYTTCYFLGMSYYASKLYFDAVKWLEKAFNRNDEDINLCYYYGSCLAKTYDRRKGIEILEKGIDKINGIQKMLPDFYTEMAEAHIRQKEYLQGIEKYKTAYGLDKQPVSLFEIANVYEMIQDDKNAIAYFERFLKTMPKDLKIEELAKIDNNKNLSANEYRYAFASMRLRELHKKQFMEGASKK